MALNVLSSRIVLALPLLAIGLALANWNTKPAGAWAWAAVIVMSVVMIAAHRGAQRASSRSPGNAALVKSVDSVPVAVAFGALMMIIPLALTLAHAYGVVDVDNSDSAAGRAILIMIGAYLAMTGNAMPRMLPPPSSMPDDGARVQAFQRLAGWTWVLCGLGFAVVGLALPIDAVTPASMVLAATAMIVTIVQLLRLRKRGHTLRA